MGQKQAVQAPPPPVDTATTAEVEGTTPVPLPDFIATLRDERKKALDAVELRVIETATTILNSVETRNAILTWAQDGESYWYKFLSAKDLGITEAQMGATREGVSKVLRQRFPTFTTLRPSNDGGNRIYCQIKF